MNFILRAFVGESSNDTSRRSTHSVSSISENSRNRSADKTSATDNGLAARASAEARDSVPYNDRLDDFAVRAGVPQATRRVSLQRNPVT